MTDIREGIKNNREVFDAWVAGEEIEYLDNSPELNATWQVWTNDIMPDFNNSYVDYRIKVTADTIDWSHVAPGYTHMARNEDGRVFVRTDSHCDGVQWHTMGKITNPCTDARVFASYKRGTCDWRDSLVSRAQCEAPDVAKAVDHE